MGTVRVVLLVVVAFARSSTAEFIPEYAQYANALFDRVETRLTKDMTELKSSIESISRKLQNSCSATTQQAPSPDNLQEKMETLAEKVEAMESKIDETLTKMRTLESTLQMTEQLATEKDLKHLTGYVGDMLDETTRYIESRVGAMATKAQVEELLGTYVENVAQVMTEAIGTCGSDVKLTEVLQEVREVKEDVAKVTNGTEATKEEVKQCNKQDAMQELRNLITKMEGLHGKVDDLETGLKDKLHNITEVVLEAFNNTQSSPPTTPTPNQAQGTIYPCEDSSFVGASSINVCQSAVRFTKCRLEAVSYHCCHSCTSARQLPEMGPWRYINHSREVSTFDVTRFFAL